MIYIDTINRKTFKELKFLDCVDKTLISGENISETSINNLSNNWVSIHRIILNKYKIKYDNYKVLVDNVDMNYFKRYYKSISIKINR